MGGQEAWEGGQKSGLAGAFENMDAELFDKFDAKAHALRKLMAPPSITACGPKVCPETPGRHGPPAKTNVADRQQGGPTEDHGTDVECEKSGLFLDLSRPNTKQLAALAATSVLGVIVGLLWPWSA